MTAQDQSKSSGPSRSDDETVDLDGEFFLVAVTKYPETAEGTMCLTGEGDLNGS